MDFTATTTSLGTLVQIAGNAQIAPPNAPLWDPLRVRVVDPEGHGIPDQFVFFTVTAGNGSLEHTVVATDGDGYAENIWTLGASGPQQVTVSAETDDGQELEGSPVVFVATVANSMSLQVHDPDQHWLDTVADCHPVWRDIGEYYGAALPHPPQVRVTQGGQPVPNIPIHFTIPESNWQTGSVISPVMTDENGIATTQWVPEQPDAFGTHALHSGLSTINMNGPTFYGYDSYGAARLVYISGEEQGYSLGQILTQPLVVRVVDMSGNGVGGVSVLFQGDDNFCLTPHPDEPCGFVIGEDENGNPVDVDLLETGNGLGLLLTTTDGNGYARAYARFGPFLYSSGGVEIYCSASAGYDHDYTIWEPCPYPAIDFPSNDAPEGVFMRTGLFRLEP